MKISQILIGATVTAFVKLNAFFNLLANGLFGTAIRWVEGVVAAKGAAASADFTIAVRTTESCIDADFLDTAAKLLGEISIVAVETAGTERIAWHIEIPK